MLDIEGEPQPQPYKLSVNAPTPEFIIKALNIHSNKKIKCEIPYSGLLSSVKLQRFNECLNKGFKKGCIHLCLSRNGKT